MRDEFQKTLVFKIIVSNEKQYSLWLLDREVPPGWYDVEPMQGSAMECMAYIKELYFRERQLDAEPVSSYVSQAQAPETSAYA